MMALMVLEDFVLNLVDAKQQLKKLRIEMFQEYINVHYMENGNVNIVMTIQFLRHVESWKNINENSIQFQKEVLGIKA